MSCVLKIHRCRCWICAMTSRGSAVNGMKRCDSTHLTKHRQFFGKVHHSGYGRGDNFCKLTEGFYVHLVSFSCIVHGSLTNILRLKQQKRGGQCVWVGHLNNTNRVGSLLRLTFFKYFRLFCLHAKK